MDLDEGEAADRLRNRSMSGGVPEVLQEEAEDVPPPPNKKDFWAFGRRYFGLIYTLLSTASFSLSSTILKKYSHIHPFNLGTWAFPLAALVSVPFILYTIQVEKKSVVDSKLTKLLVRTLLSSVVPYTIILSLKYISVADMRTVLAASVISIYFLGWLFLDEQCGIVPTVVVIMALCGIGVISRPPVLTGKKEFDSDTLIGVSLALASMALVTVIILSLRFLQTVHQGTLNCLLYSYSFGQSLVLAIVFGKLTVPASVGDGLAMVSAGLLMAVGNVFLVLALQVEEAGVVALIRTSEVVFTFFWQFVILGVAPDLISVVGAGLVLTGVVVVTLRKWVASLPADHKHRPTFAFLLN